MEPLTKYPEAPESSAAMVLADKLREAVLAEYSNGQLVGSEDDLVAAHGVSRPTFRQAMRVLQAEGLISVRRGNNGGFFARMPSAQALARSSSLLLRHQGATLQHLHEISELVGPEVAAAAALNKDAQLRANFAASVEQSWRGQAALSRESFIRLATGFGERLCSICPNPVLALFSSITSELVWISVSGGRDQESEERVRALRRAHFKIGKAVAAGDTSTARNAMARLSRAAASWR